VERNGRGMELLRCEMTKSVSGREWMLGAGAGVKVSSEVGRCEVVWRDRNSRCEKSEDR
jgi:hypothetical protein